MAPDERTGVGDPIDPWTVEDQALPVSGVRARTGPGRERSAEAAPSTAASGAGDSEGVLPVVSDAPELVGDLPDSLGLYEDLEGVGVLGDLRHLAIEEGLEELQGGATDGPVAEGVLYQGEPALGDAAEFLGLEDFVDDFDPEARRSPWESEVEETHSDYRSSEKAAKIAKLLKVRCESERQAAVADLQDLFTEYPHPATFRAIDGLCRVGIDLDTLMTTVTLRSLWLEEPCTWQRRGDGLHLPSWSLALRVAVARAEYPVEQMFDLDWLRDWQALTRGSPGYPSVAAYVEVVLERTAGDPRWAALSRRATAIDRVVITADLSGDRRRLNWALDRAEVCPMYFFKVEPGTVDSRSAW